MTTSPFRRCLWPSCRHLAARLVYCHAHYEALGQDLQARLKSAQGTDDWVAALEACQHHAKTTIEWVRKTFHGGDNAHPDAKAR
jgi:hypothetical protein